MSHAFFFEPPIENNFLGHIFAEVYKEKVYAPFVEGKNLKTCLEIGGNVGIVSYYFAKHFQKVYVLEPSLEHFDNLTKMIAHNKLDNVHPINKALFMKSGKFPFFHNGNKTMYSLHQAVSDPGLNLEEVDAITLTQLFSEFSIDHVDFMKLDVEGSEFEIVCSTPFKEVAPKIDSILVEVHAWADRNPQQIVDGLKDAGFNNVNQIPNDANLLIATK